MIELVTKESRDSETLSPVVLQKALEKSFVLYVKQFPERDLAQQPVGSLFQPISLRDLSMSTLPTIADMEEARASVPFLTSSECQQSQSISKVSLYPLLGGKRAMTYELSPERNAKQQKTTIFPIYSSKCRLISSVYSNLRSTFIYRYYVSSGKVDGFSIVNRVCRPIPVGCKAVLPFKSSSPPGPGFQERRCVEDWHDEIQDLDFGRGIDDLCLQSLANPGQTTDGVFQTISSGR